MPSDLPVLRLLASKNSSRELHGCSWWHPPDSSFPAAGGRKNHVAARFPKGIIWESPTSKIKIDHTEMERLHSCFDFTGLWFHELGHPSDSLKFGPVKEPKEPNLSTPPAKPGRLAEEKAHGPHRTKNLRRAYAKSTPSRSKPGSNTQF